MSSPIAETTPVQRKRRTPLDWLYRQLGPSLAKAVIGVVSVGLTTGAVTLARAVYAAPGRLTTLEAQVGTVIKRQRVDSARTDSLFRMQSGVVSVLCFGLSDKAFEAAKDLCGEAFHVSRVLADERLRRRPQ